ncbi:uroporphyrinogen-III C-methyltransferase [Paralcaligenes sp. KSB-10]|uniref:uroporphyrinogen-III C-methyltransferase n=1 Tax=Paralcaligenes sp. KSB-10 TaxID=2901142 RepID=UPI001E51F914|nr:uroporphyrinogen-III C-methyltransferase [Paralcaligenes sp. KSB-10]UHL65048.1 uroporphyrinogen-III C-methyltransferase [Paralcaligenes sp. KSB-10]
MKTSAHIGKLPSPGKVWLIGAGPGDAELLTLKAARVLKQCTVWLVDDLVGRDILELAEPETKIIEVGKRGGCASTPQDFILRLMAQYALEGKTVARLKGGDPFIFGRGGEEMAWLTHRGIEVESVSGITAGLAVASALGLPLTHREVSRGVILVTAHTADGVRPDWQSLARSGLTLVCYMGMSQPAVLLAELLEGGFPATLPLAIVQHVSCAAQRYVVTTLEHLASTVETSRIASPAVIVLGEVVRHAQALPRQDAGETGLLARAV